MRKEVLALSVLLLVIIPLVNSNQIVETAGGENNFSTEEDVIFTYNFSINNNNSGQDSNITKLIITIPSNLSLISGTQGTNANANNFTNSSTTLTWENSTYYLINGSETKYFWFDGNVTTPGNYSISLETTNSSGTSTFSLNLTINPATISCVENWTYTNWTTCINSSQERNATDSNSCGTTDSRNAILRTCETGTNSTNTTNCTSSWTTGAWSTCIGGLQTRDVNDTNSCTNTTGKPSISQTCTVACLPEWECDDWSECEDEEKTRKCADKNSCGTTEGKPPEDESCEDEKGLNWKPILIILGALIGSGIIVGIAIFFLRKKPEIDMPMQQDNGGFVDPNNMGGMPPGMPPGPPIGMPAIPRLPRRKPGM